MGFMDKMDSMDNLLFHAATIPSRR